MSVKIRKLRNQGYTLVVRDGERRTRFQIRLFSRYWRTKPHPWFYFDHNKHFGGTFQTGPLEIFWNKRR